MYYGLVVSFLFVGKVFLFLFGNLTNIFYYQ
jgi:hypothetical protein